MIVGIQTEMFHDKRGHRVLHIKKKEQYYQLGGNDEFKVKLLQNNSMNAISISVILGVLLQWHWALYVAVAIVVYIAYLLYFNRKVLPRLSVLKSKRIERDEAKREDSRQMLTQAIVFPILAAGLLYCLWSDQVEGQMLTAIVWIVIVLSLLIGGKAIFFCLRRAARAR